ncbi:MAG: hypothetical protein Q8O01_06890 [Candidatus Omnitrophota bacterium]|nr:hypothetical protein [Candidatus Omnitrophota bacterium]
MSNQRKIPLVLAVSFLSVFLCGCATIINGTSQKIQVTSEPTCAMVQVDSGDTYTTPIRLRLERKRGHLLVFTKDGYETQTVKLMHVISEVVIGNTLLGGPIGWVFDIFAGTQYKLVPNPVCVELKRRE